jgi:membrane-bound lytic murein transglycosylase D
VNRRSGAVGLAQFLPATWCEVSPTGNPFNPRDATMAQARYMADLFARFGDWTRALAAYNWGQGHLAKHLADHGGRLAAEALPEETRRYLERVLELEEELVSA